MLCLQLQICLEKPIFENNHLIDDNYIWNNYFNRLSLFNFFEKIAFDWWMYANSCCIQKRITNTKYLRCCYLWSNSFMTHSQNTVAVKCKSYWAYRSLKCYSVDVKLDLKNRDELSVYYIIFEFICFTELNLVCQCKVQTIFHTSTNMAFLHLCNPDDVNLWYFKSWLFDLIQKL